MRILITSAASNLGQALAANLSADHDLLLLDGRPASCASGSETLVCDLFDAKTVAAAVEGVEAVIHTGELPVDAPADGRFAIDWLTRGTHVLFSAAVAAGATRFLYGGTLRVFDSYPEDVYIDVYHRPLPHPETGVMSRYLGELTCREFARDHLITVSGLRLGDLVRAEDAPETDVMWLDPRDAALAFRCALDRDASSEPSFALRWALYHVSAVVPNPRFLPADPPGYQQRHASPASPGCGS